ncbi:zinc finger mynd domain-containing protein [Moniliophthora roreri]|nr:zinc finger mynd domain-containing protein [Moniliophthora roreri]
MPPPRAHDAHPVSPPLSGFIAEGRLKTGTYMGIDPGSISMMSWIRTRVLAQRILPHNISVRTAGHSFGHGH